MPPTYFRTREEHARALIESALRALEQLQASYNFVDTDDHDLWTAETALKRVKEGIKE